MRSLVVVLALVLIAGAVVYLHRHGGVTDPGGCPADEIAYYGGC